MKLLEKWNSKKHDKDFSGFKFVKIHTVLDIENFYEKLGIDRSSIDESKDFIDYMTLAQKFNYLSTCDDSW